MLVDPWLVGSEVDGFRWLNEQWHIREPVAPDELPAYQVILITQSYQDHCHPQTLALLPAGIPILCTAKAYRKMKKFFPERNITLLNDSGNPVSFGGLSFRSLRPDKILDPVYYGVSISEKESGSVFYCPHGFTPLPEQEKWLTEQSCLLLMTTFTDFRLPKIMGGNVNPGPGNVQALCRLLHPRFLVNTHDEKKKGKGLVFRLGKITYYDTVPLEGTDAVVLQLDDYSEKTLELPS